MFDFLKYRYACLVFFLVILSATVGGYWYNIQKRGYGFHYSVDFTGGTSALFKLKNYETSSKVKSILDKSRKFQGIETRELSDNQVLIRVQDFSGDVQGVGGKLLDVLSNGLRQNSVELLQADSVGSSVGDSLRSDSIKAILIALLLMLLYVAIRFRFAFSVGAVFALFHDALVIAAFFLLTNREISIDVIGAILMTLGYSVNDTIVIFSRIRENMGKMGNKPIKEIVNLSISQTLRRTVLTSLSTALVVGSLIVFGGEMLRGLSIALLLGIIFGTYSSIFIASPVMLMINKGYKKKAS